MADLDPCSLSPLPPLVMAVPDTAISLYLFRGEDRIEGSLSRLLAGEGREGVLLLLPSASEPRAHWMRGSSPSNAK